MVDCALTVSKQKQLFHGGHSQGTVMGFGGFTFNKTLAAQVKAFFALAPVAMVTHVQGAFYLISKFYKQIEVSLTDPVCAWERGYNLDQELMNRHGEGAVN